MTSFLNNRFSLFISISLLFLVFLINSLPPIEWGYDEFGAIISHLELDNITYKAVYREYLTNIGITNPKILEFVVNYVLPIVVVPIRWTYAIGISPVLGFSRFIDFDWPTLGFILMLPYILFAILGAYLVSLSISNKGDNYSVFYIFLSFIMLSHPFLKWTLTLTSYSHHLFCFGLLLYSETQLVQKNKIFSKTTISRSIVQLFNYQYIVIYAVIGLYQFITNYRTFFKNKIFLNWLLPGLVALVSVFFLFFRAFFSGKHLNPAYTNNTELYNFSANKDSFFYAIKFLIDSLIDFLNYFFIQKESFYGGPSSSDLSFFGLSVFILISLSIYLKVLSQINIDIKKLILITIVALLIPYLSGVQPLVATRHSLVLFLPITLIFSYTVFIFFESILSKKNILLGVILLLLFSSYKAIGFKNYENESLDMEKVSTKISQYGVKHLVLSPCDYKPILYKEIREKYKVSYRCGPQIFIEIPSSEKRIVILSENPILSRRAKEIIADYSSDEWNLIEGFYDILKCNKENNSENICKSTSHIFERVADAD
jgi:hypothetical protein